MYFTSESRPKLTAYLYRKYSFCDDSAIVAHTAEKIQVLVDQFKSAARSFSKHQQTKCL